MLYQGSVIDNQDPQKMGRVKVYVKGVHLDETTLPWAEVMGSTAFGLSHGTGVSSVLQKGTEVWVVFKDAECMFPVVVGVCTGVDDDGKTDIHDSLNSEYGNMQTITTPSGHMVQFADTAGDERIIITHKSGSSITIDHEGNFIFKGVKDCKIEVPGNCYIKSDNFTLEASETSFDTSKATVSGQLNVSGDTITGGIPFLSHTHICDGNTSPPV